MTLTFSKFLPVPIMIGIVAAVWVWLTDVVTVEGYPLVAWVPFLSWALHFMAGAKMSRVSKEAVGLTGGIVFAVFALVAMMQLGSTLGQFTMPVIVFFAAFFIVLLEWTDLFELAPAYFFSFAGYFAFLFGGFMGTEMNMQHIIWYWVLIMIGLGIGVLTAELRKWILSSQGVSEADQQTVFDREMRMQKTGTMQQ